MLTDGAGIGENIKILPDIFHCFFPTVFEIQKLFYVPPGLRLTNPTPAMECIYVFCIVLRQGAIHSLYNIKI
jgi:hypothetical protein